MNIEVNFMIIVFVAVMGAMLFSALWYSQKAFGKAWMQLAHVDPSAARDAKRGIFITFLANFACAMTLFTILNWAGATTALHGAAVGVWLGCGLSGMSLLVTFLWEGRPIRLFLITAGNAILSVVVMCAIMAHLIGKFGAELP